MTDLVVSLARHGYQALVDVWPDETSEALKVRALGGDALLVRGAGGARVFYDTSLTHRHRAVPAVVAKPLFGRGAVHGLDGRAHDHRKAMFMGVLGDNSTTALTGAVAEHWMHRTSRWSVTGSVDVFQEAVAAIGAAALEWSGVEPRLGPDAAHDLAAIVEGFGSAGPVSAVRRRLARRRCERWAARAIRVSRGRGRSAEHTAPVDVVAHATEIDGRPLDDRVAAVELLNLIRPAVAVAWFVAFAAVALSRNPGLRERLDSTTGDERHRRAFAHELRRAYPFVPALAARAREDFEWQGHRIGSGQRLILDVWGTNHLAARWPNPERFDITRFLDQPVDAFDFIPQGGGEPFHGHRCPGEPATVGIIAVCTRGLADLDTVVAPADRRFPFSRMPTRPLSGPRLSGPE